MEWSDPTGEVRLAEVHVDPAWIGQRVLAMEQAAPCRIALVTRMGSGMLPDPEMLFQEGDLLHVLLRDEDLTAVERHPRPPAGAGRLMRVVIAGAGNVGRSIAAELVGNDHQVLLIDKDAGTHPPGIDPRAPSGWRATPARWSCSRRAGLPSCQVVVAATGDDKVNLVLSLLAKTEYGVPRVVARVNHPKNEWMFNEAWGVDVAVSTPRMLSALVEEAVSIGDLVRLFTFRQGGANLVELTLPPSSPYAGYRVSEVPWPTDAVLVAIMRDGAVLAPSADDAIEPGDELLFVASSDVEPMLEELLSPHGHDGGSATT